MQIVTEIDGDDFFFAEADRLTKSNSQRPGGPGSLGFVLDVLPELSHEI